MYLCTSLVVCAPLSLEKLAAEICPRGCYILCTIIRWYVQHQQRTIELGPINNVVTAGAGQHVPHVRLNSVFTRNDFSFALLAINGKNDISLQAHRPKNCALTYGPIGTRYENTVLLVPSIGYLVSCSHAKIEHQRAPPGVFDSVPVCKPGLLQLDTRCLRY